MAEGRLRNHICNNVTNCASERPYETCFVTSLQNAWRETIFTGGGVLMLVSVAAAMQMPGNFGAGKVAMSVLRPVPALMLVPPSVPMQVLMSPDVAMMRRQSET